MRLRLLIGTRESPLALRQSQEVAYLLQSAGHAPELRTYTSQGDEDQLRPLAQIGGKGVFTKVLDQAVLSKQVSLAVHSLKDLPTDLEPGLCIAAVLPREDPTDVLIARQGLDFLTHPDYPAVIATGSPRRSAQWLARYPAHSTVDLRGNLATRLRKLYDSTWDGAIFALAGLKRQGLATDLSLPLTWMLPAPGQGAIAVVTLASDHTLREVLAQLDHLPTRISVEAERAFLSALGGGCSAPVGALALPTGTSDIRLKGVISVPHSTEQMFVETTGEVTTPGAAVALGRHLAQLALAQGAAALLAQGKGGQIIS